MGSAARRVLDLAYWFLIHENATVRSAAAVYDISRSTVHRMLTVYLKEYDENIYVEVRKKLAQNLAMAHIRGGESTRLRWEKIRNGVA